MLEKSCNEFIWELSSKAPVPGGGAASAYVGALGIALGSMVGKPLAMMLVKEGATVTICNSKTKNLSLITSNADVIVTAVAKANYFEEN